METCVRGFSFMPEVKTSSEEVPTELQFIEGSELERTWRQTRRQKMKEREQKIWEDFVKEQDAVSKVISDDPYQFLERMPEEVLREKMKAELIKLKKEVESESGGATGGSGAEAADSPEAAPSLTFAEGGEVTSGMFHIFDNDEDNDEGVEENTEDAVDSPCTVRENEGAGEGKSGGEAAAEWEGEGEGETDDDTNVQVRPSSSQHSDNVTSLIESSIYCVKVRDARDKLAEELASVAALMTNKIFLDVDVTDVTRLTKKSSEFANRFNRVHIYQLQRQLHETSRGVSALGAAAGARHTLARSHLARVASLTHNLRAATHALRKSFDKTCFCFESGAALLSLTRAIRDADLLCRAAHTHAPLPLHTLYTDNVIPYCDKVEETYKEYMPRLEEILNSFGNQTTRGRQRVWLGHDSEPYSATSAYTARLLSKRKMPYTPKSAEVMARLSMYSRESGASDRQARRPTWRGDTVRSTGSNTTRLAAPRAPPEPEPVGEETQPTNKHKKKMGRPLMRCGGGARRRPAPEDTDLHTLVENINLEPNVSGAESANNSPRFAHLRPAAPAASPRADKSPRVTTAKEGKTTKEVAPEPKKNVKVVNLKYPDQIELNVDENKKGKKASEGDVSLDVEMPRQSKTAGVDHSHSFRRRRFNGTTETSQSQREFYTPQTAQYANISNTTTAPDRSPRKSWSSTTPPRTDATRRQPQQLDLGSPTSIEPNTPQLLKFLEEIIQTKAHVPAQPKPLTPRQRDKLRLSLDIPERIADRLFQYRTQFVQHMLTSHMYAASTIEKPWEAIGCASEKIIDELLLNCAKEMELIGVINNMCKSETC